MKVALYARLSRSGSLADQAGPMWKRAAAQGWDAKLFIEQASTPESRPIREELIKKLRAREFDGVCVHSLDRWTKSVEEFAVEVEGFRGQGITFHSIKEGFDFDMATGLASMAKVFRQLEKDLNREKTCSGLVRARASKRVVGRHPRGCGCGVTVNGKVHGGLVRPVFDGEGRVIDWDAPEGVQVRMRPRHQVPSVEAGAASP